MAIRPNGGREVAAGMEICFMTEIPEEAYIHAVSASAIPLKQVKEKPWGQKVACVRDLNGCLVELCSPISR
jgi:uncharacterized glyoxalase superfamily protein PhnB